MPMHLVCIDYTMILRESHADSKIIKRKPPLSVVVCRDFFFQHFHHPFARVMAVFSLSAHREDRDADMIANFGNVKTAPSATTGSRSSSCGALHSDPPFVMVSNKDALHKSKYD